MCARFFALTLLLACTLAPAAAQVHRWVDERGVVQYGDRPPGGATPLRLRSESATAPSGIPTPAAAVPRAAVPAPAATVTERAQRPAAPTVDRLLAQRVAGAAPTAPTAASPGMQALVAQCKANRGVDCDTPQGMRNLQRENTPITREEQARIAGLRARRATCARVPGSLGC